MPIRPFHIFIVYVCVNTRVVLATETNGMLATMNHGVYWIGQSKHAYIEREKGRRMRRCEMEGEDTKNHKITKCPSEMNEKTRNHTFRSSFCLILTMPFCFFFYSKSFYSANNACRRAIVEWTTERQRSGHDNNVELKTNRVCTEILCKCSLLPDINCLFRLQPSPSSAVSR